MKYVTDILFLFGILLVVIPSFMINLYFGMYLTGVILIAGTLFIESKPKENREE
jgi:hypothetical protein